MQRTAEVGVVVPARNAERFLAATLASIRDQTFTDWVCVVVDDGSIDATAEAASAFCDDDDRFELLRQAWSGPCVARNNGMGRLCGRVHRLSFMDADDVWHGDALATLVDACERDPEALGAHGLGDFIDEDGHPLYPGTFAAFGRGRVGCRGGWPRPWEPQAPTTFENVMTVSILFPPGVMLADADAYSAVGPFDDSVRHAEDLDMVIRLTRLGHLAFVDRVILGYRRHDANLGMSAPVAQACARVRRKAYASPENSPRQREIARDAWRAAQVIDARQRLRDASALARDAEWSRASQVASRLPVVAYRYLRGRPLPPADHVVADGDTTAASSAN
ncbi:MAG TPA: glycosyltransferase [Acidimicrobiia bacterium]|nr:glycosyltransferase [Acidimicrobiia bacterium]